MSGIAKLKLGIKHPFEDKASGLESHEGQK